MSVVTVAHLRRHHELVVLNTRRREAFVAPKYGADLEVDPYVEVIQSIAEGDLNKEYKLELAQMWERLGSVTEFDAQTVDDISSILLSTTPDDTTPCAEPWRVPIAPTVVKATAAHPRAYRGTKTRPPKQSQLPSVDLRPHLCNARDTREIIRFLGDRLEQRAQQMIDTYSYPDSFRRSFGLLPLFAWELTPVALGLYWDLGLAEDEPLRHCVARLLRNSWNEWPLPWCDAIKSIDPMRRVAALEQVCESEIYLFTTTEEARWLIRLSELSDDQQFRNRVYALTKSLRYNDSQVGLFAGFELANTYRPEFDFIDKSHDENSECDPIVQWTEHVRLDETNEASRTSMALVLWAACGNLPEFYQWLERCCWSGLDRDVAYELIDPFLDCQYGDSPAQATACWDQLTNNADDYVQAIKSLPAAYQIKGIRIFRQAVWETSVDFGEAIRRTLGLLPIVCCEPMLTQTNSHGYTAMLDLDAHQYQRFCASPVRCFRVLEKACQSDNDAKLINRSLITMTAGAADVLIRSFHHCPSTLMRALKTLGCLAPAQRSQILNQWREHALVNGVDKDLANPESENGELRKTVLRIEDNLPADVHNPIPKKVRAYAHGELELTDGQIKRGLSQVRENLLQSQIDLLRSIALQNLASSIEAVDLTPDEAVAHAARLQNLSSENRRGLRKFLRAYLSGDDDYLNQHPANRRWLTEHGAIAERWQAGMTIRQTLEQDGDLEFSIETNPLEALRLGSYVGSCLGIGGMLAVSAAAVVLDVNKAVVYARNQRGRVVARQLLAISDDNQLVCFGVYPTTAPRDMKKSFSHFDQVFAKSLGIELHLADNDNCTDTALEISRTISKYWWDDGAWNPTSDDDVA